MAITKNKQSTEKIEEICKLAFGEKEIIEILELKEGMCNVAYMITFSDNAKVVLKIASSGNLGYMRNEQNLMVTEVQAMKIAKSKGIKGVADVLFYDDTLKICDGKYFFMSALNGMNYFNVKERFRKEEIENVSREIGELQKELKNIENNFFGIVGAENKFDTLFDFFKNLFLNVIEDGKDVNVEISVDFENLISKLEEEKNIFDEVKKATLVHWDMWEGNIFVKDKKIVGVIDWERAMWADPFLDDRFREHTRTVEFLDGFGIDELSENEIRRIQWYDLFLYLTMAVEIFYRKYDDEGYINWVKSMLNDTLTKMFN